jgi:uncharacterized protein YdeI (YjbR/CyaY-like superfamily)
MREQAETISVRDRAAWRRWLERNHARPTGVWLPIRKKGSAKHGVSIHEAQEEALCFGWIDSTANRLDDDRFLIWMAPRKPTSVWSKVNKERVARLLAEGLIAEPGLAAIRTAQGNGSWEALDAVDRLELPDDLAAALAANPAALANYDAFPPSAKKLIIHRVTSAKRPETRAKRIEETVRLAERNERAGQARPSGGRAGGSPG